MNNQSKNQLEKPPGTGKLLWFLIGLPLLVVLLLVGFWLLFEHTRKPSVETTSRQSDQSIIMVIQPNNTARSSQRLIESAEQTA